MKRIFVVEDEAVVAMELKDRLRALGFEVCGHAARGDAALREIPAAHPDLVLMDVNLGRGISGLEVAEQLRAVLDVPVIFLTAYSDTELAERAGRAGSFAYIVKPFDPRVLGVTISLALARHEATVALRESEARFRAIFEQAAVGVAEIDTVTGCFVRVNRKCAETFGYSGDEMPGLDVLTMTHPDDRAADRACLDQLRRGERRSYALEQRCVRKDGSIVWVHQSVSPLWAPGEAPSRHMAVVEDVTARREAEEALRRSEHRLSEAQRLAVIGSWVWDIEANTTEWSAGLFEMFGVSPAEFDPGAYEAFVGLLHPDDRARVVDVMQDAMRTLEPFATEYRIIRPDGSERYIDARGAVVARDGCPVLLHGSSQDITERRRAETTLRESEQRLAFALEATAEGLWDWNIQTGAVLFSPQWIASLGYSPEDVAPTVEFWQSIVHPDDLAGTMDAVRAHFAEQTPNYECENRVRMKSGQYRFNLDKGKVVEWDAAGRPLRMVGTDTDLSARHAQTEALRVLSTGLSRFSGEAFFEEAARQAAAIVGADVGFVATVHPGPGNRLRTLGMAVDGQVTPPGDRALAGTPSEQVLGGRVLVFPEGVQSRFPLDTDLVAMGIEAYVAAPLFDVSGRVLGNVGVMSRRPMAHPGQVESIIELFALRCGAELERQRAEARFGGVFEFAPDAILIADDGGRIVLANRMAEETLGYDRQELLGLGIEDLVPERERRGHAARRAGFLRDATARRMGSSRSRLWARRKDGTNVPVEISLSPLRMDEGEMVVAVVRDVTERVQVEDERTRLEVQLRHAQKMEALGTLAGGIAHDFNNLLHVIMANTELAQEEAGSNDRVVERLGGVMMASSRAVDLVRQILAFSRQQPARRAITSVRAVVEEAAKLLRATIPAGIEIATVVDDGVPNVYIDPSQFHQVLMNLGTNAWHAIERPTGKIVFHVDAVTVAVDPLPVADLEPGRYARVRVTDDGAGMEPDTIERIFEPFFTTKATNKGTGLGLAVVHGIVADHGGAITVDSAPGRGTTVAVYLPEAAGEPVEEVRMLPSFDRAVGRVLLIDDEEALARVAARVIERMGYRVTSFTRAADALEAFRADPQAFDVVVTDQNMPGMGGLEVARTLGQLRPGLPVVLISGNRVLSDEELAAANIRYYVDKPFTGDMLRAVLERALAGG